MIRLEIGSLAEPIPASNQKIKNAFAEKGIKLATDSYTNQVFVDLGQEQINKLEKDVIFSVEFFGIGENQSSRFVTSESIIKEG